ncbi:MAG: NUDIX domain-containing protein [Bacteroidota bacterium]
MQEHNPWKTISTETKYENPWIRVDESKVINPAGNDGIYGVVHFKNRAMAIIPLDDENNTWIVGQFRFTTNTYEWEVIEGGVPEGEDLLEGAKRELEEEAGLIANEWTMIIDGCQLSNSVSDEIGYAYVARGLTLTATNPEETEQLQIRKLPFTELEAMVMNGEIKDLLSVASVLKVKRLIDENKI